jgi:hypothetical protein
VDSPSRCQPESEVIGILLGCNVSTLPVAWTRGQSDEVR